MISFPPDSFSVNGDSPSTIACWARTFYAYHEQQKHLRWPGKDQTVFNALLVLFNEHYCRISEGPRGTPRKYWRGSSFEVVLNV